VIKWNPEQRRIGEVILKHKREDGSYDYKGVKADIPQVPDGTIGKIAKALKESNWQLPEKPGKQVGGAVVTVTERKPAAIVFTLGDIDIILNPAYLYDSYLYYLDIQRLEPDIDDEFTLAIRAAMKHVWEDFAHRKVERAGVTIKEVEQ